MPDLRDVPDDPPPFLGTWRRVYVAVLVYLCPRHRRPLLVHPSLEMRPLDWIVLVVSLVSIVALRPLPQPRQQYRGSLPAGRQVHALVRHGALHHGHPGQRHHLHLHHRPILRGRHALRAVLFRAAHRHGDHLRHRGPRSSTAPRSTPLTSSWSGASTARRAPSPASSSCASAASRPASPSTRRPSCSPSSWAGRSASPPR